jgi:hypothetical protein
VAAAEVPGFAFAGALAAVDAGAGVVGVDSLGVQAIGGASLSFLGV